MHSGLGHGYNRRNEMVSPAPLHCHAQIFNDRPWQLASRGTTIQFATNDYELQSRDGRDEESILPITISKNVMTDSDFPNSSFKY
jgi:hypothetical protein